MKRIGSILNSFEPSLSRTKSSMLFQARKLSAIAQMERDVISERTRDALSHKKKNNEWCGRVPYGFKIENGRLVENSTQIKTIQKAKRMRRSGKSMRDISRALNLSVGYVHKALNVNLRSVKSLYCKA